MPAATNIQLTTFGIKISKKQIMYIPRRDLKIPPFILLKNIEYPKISMVQGLLQMLTFVTKAKTCEIHDFISFLYKYRILCI